MSSKADSYDFIVVGAGTAGCVVASRLSEDASARVLLVEAGSAQPLELMAVPPAWPALLQSPASWGDFTVRQAATGTSTILARGRGLGGSSAINAMMFARGHRSGYDVWVKAGAKGWGFDDLLPYFKRSESAQGRDPALRGTGGPLTVGPASPPNPVVVACLEAAAEQGHSRATDLSGGLEEGFGWPDLNIVGGKRQSAADAYLTPAVLDRPNLDVVTDALVHRVQIDAGRCTGIRYSAGAELVSVACSREVVLTAGSIGSAQLLMLSGIGPRRHLKEVGVEVVLDLPGVGSSLQDHPVANLVYSAARPTRLRATITVRPSACSAALRHWTCPTSRSYSWMRRGTSPPARPLTTATPSRRSSPSPAAGARSAWPTPSRAPHHCWTRTTTATTTISPRWSRPCAPPGRSDKRAPSAPGAPKKRHRDRTRVTTPACAPT